MNLDLHNSESHESDQLAAECQAAMRQAIQSIAVGPDRGRDITRELAALVMRGILNGDIDDVQTAVFLIALRMKRESINEFLGLSDTLFASTISAVAGVDNILILADPFDGYSRNVSMTPFIPAVLAACGYYSVMHGVETVGPKHGVTAHKVFKLAGMNTLRSAQSVANDIATIGWGYVDQSVYAPSVFKLHSLRDSIVKRTALTTLERLLMPIRGALTTNLVLGYVHKAYPEIYATVAKELGYDKVLLLKGVEGGLAPALNKPVRRFFFDQRLPVDNNSEKQVLELSGVFSSKTAAMGMGEAQYAVEQCLKEGVDVLNGGRSLARDSLSLACAQILTAYQADLSLIDAVEKVRVCLDNGSAKAKFDAAVFSRT